MALKVRMELWIQEPHHVAKDEELCMHSRLIAMEIRRDVLHE